jgi:hypothetical protein
MARGSFAAMSERIVIEVETGPKWTRLGSVAPDEPPGMVDAYAFGWHNGQGPCVWDSTDLDLDVTAHLNTGPHTIPITGRDGTANVRFRYQRS